MIALGFVMGIGLFVIAGFLYLDSRRSIHRHVWEPLSMHLPHGPSEIDSPEFFLERGVYYVVEIAPHGGMGREDFSWSLSERGNPVAPSVAIHNAGGGNSDEQFYGSIHPEHDGHYKLHLLIRDFSLTGGTNPPELKVVLDPGERADIVNGAGAVEFFAEVCGFLGLVAWAFAVTGIILKRRQMAPLKQGSACH